MFLIGVFLWMVLFMVVAGILCFLLLFAALVLDWWGCFRLALIMGGFIDMLVLIFSWLVMYFRGGFWGVSLRVGVGLD